MRLLLVEDDINKLDRLNAFLAEQHPLLDVQHAASLLAGLRMAKELKPDVVILDMTLPNYDGPTDAVTNRMRAFGGVEFIRQSARLGFKAKIVVVTQFESFGEPPHLTSLEDLRRELGLNYPDVFVGAVYYHAAQAEWKIALNDILSKIFASFE